MGSSPYVIFCDDVRIEESKKRIFVGIYGTEMFLNEIPTVLAKHCVISTLVCTLDDLPEFIKVKLQFDGAIVQAYEVADAELAAWKEKISSDLAPEVEEFRDEEPPKARLSVEIVISPFLIENEGRLSAYIETEKGVVRAGSLKILKGQSPR